MPKVKSRIVETENNNNKDNTISKNNQLKKNLDYGHRQRLREQIINNYNTITKEKIFEYLMCMAIPMKDTRVLSKNILEKFNGNFLNIFNKSAEFLKNSLHLPDTIIASILTVSKIMSYYNAEELDNYNIVNSRNELIKFFKKEIGSKDTEHTIILCLNSAQKIIEKISFGDNNLTKISFNIGNIVAKILNNKTKFVVLSHNHPSGDPTPSDEDLKTTEFFEDSIRYMGEIELVDHIIVSGNKYFSFFEHKLLTTQTKRNENKK